MPSSRRVGKHPGGINQSSVIPRFYSKAIGKAHFDLREALPILTHPEMEGGKAHKRVCSRCGHASLVGINADKHCENISLCFWRILHFGSGARKPHRWKKGDPIFFNEEEIAFCINYITELEGEK